MDEEERNATIDALRRIEEGGSDMRKPMEMDFSVHVPSEDAGRKVAQQVQALGFEASVEQDEESGEWTCDCSRSLIPLLEELTAIQERLDAIGRSVGGYVDGFGSFGNAVE